MNHLIPYCSSGIPEVPNIISLLYHRLDYPFIQLMHYWENIIFSVFASFVVVFIFLLGIRRREMIPNGLQNAIESLEELLSGFILNVLGAEGHKWIPLLGTIFIYTLVMNLFGLIPFLKSPTSNLNITAAQAICVFVLVQFLSVKNMGVKGYLYHLMGSPKDFAGWLMAPLLFPIELLTQITRPVTLAFRLFGNMFGEDVLVGYAVLVGVALVPMIYPIGVPLQIPFMFLVLFTSLIQAFVFTLLSAVYILLSMPEHEEIEN